MAIYATKVSPAEREWLEHYEKYTGVEPMFQNEIDSGAMTFHEVAQENIRWFEDWSGVVQRVISRNVPSDPDTEPTPPQENDR